MPIDVGLLETMVLSHMAMLTMISADRERISCTYIPEPILSEAAAELTDENGIFDKILDDTVKRLIKGKLEFTKGSFGQFVASVAFLRMYDIAA